MINFKFLDKKLNYKIIFKNMEKEIGILFIHGFGHHSECWVNFKEEFKKNGFHKLYYNSTF